MSRILSIAMIHAFSGSVFMQQMAEGGEGAAPVAVAKTQIRPKLDGYTTAKSASGASSKICGDDVSKALVGATLDEAYGFVSKVVSQPETDLRAKYGVRNLGQQRMFLGNLIRGAFAGKDAERAAAVRKAFDAQVLPFRDVIDARLAAATEAAQAEKDAKVKDKATKKAEADKLKADAKAKKAADKAAEKAAKPAPAPKAPKEPAAAPAKAPFGATAQPK